MGNQFSLAFGIRDEAYTGVQVLANLHPSFIVLPKVTGCTMSNNKSVHLDPSQTAVMVTVHRCARCGMTHENLGFTKFKRPVTLSDTVTYTHFSLCPTTLEPVLMRFSSISIEDDRCK